MQHDPMVAHGITAYFGDNFLVQKAGLAKTKLNRPQ